VNRAPGSLGTGLRSRRGPRRKVPQLRMGVAKNKESHHENKDDLETFFRSPQIDKMQSIL
jgi:hypothetical protein